MTRDTRILDANGKALLVLKLRLVVVQGPDTGRTATIESDEVTVGTAPTAALQLTDPTVSRNHLGIRTTDRGFRVEDLGSTNGTFIDKRRVEVAYANHGDHIDIGKTRIRLEVDGERVALALSDSGEFGSMLGISVASRRLFAMFERLAPAESSLLIVGETGVGKDTAAEAIHQASHRKKGPFIVLDCAALSGGVLESELFGHERGAYTGATEKRDGAFVAAHGGTLFIDEVGELPRDIQAKLLRAIDKREVKPLGSDTSTRIDVRIIAATNRDLKRDVNRGAFREDLYYRLSVVTLLIPPLRERPEDIAFLAKHFWRTYTGDRWAEVPVEQLTDLLARSWPGNVRELRNHIEQIVVLGKDLSPAQESEREALFKVAKASIVDAFERRYLGELIARVGGNVSEAARLAGIDRVHMTKLLRKHGLGRTG